MTIDDIKKRHTEEIKKFEMEEKIRAKLPDVGHEWSICVHTLYGSIASVSLKQPWVSGKPLTLEDALAVAEALPGVPMVKVSGTFTSYLAEQELPQYEERNKIDSETPIAPWIIDAHGGPGARNGSQCDLEWRANIDGVGLVRVEFELPFMTALRFAANRKEVKGGVRWENCRCEVDRGKLFTIYGPDGATPVANLGHYTRWASGGHEYPNKITQPWEPLDDPCRATVADFVRALIAAR